MIVIVINITFIDYDIEENIFLSDVLKEAIALAEIELLLELLELLLELELELELVDILEEEIVDMLEVEELD